MDESSIYHNYTAPALLAGTACVLAGGKSSRMGTDKALLPFGASTLLAHALSAMHAFDEVFLSARDADLYAFAGVPIVTDRTPGLGPIEGLAAALSAARHDHVCFRPVDTPLVPAALHTYLFQSLGDFDVCIPTFAGRPEPLLACYAKSMTEVLDHLANSGIRKVSEALSHARTLEIPLEDLISRWGDPAVYLVNANDPETFSQITATAAASPLTPEK
jgi:molybdopterin-guanine dinucleotide biosynthesis protein A